LHEIGADIVVLQETVRRFGTRDSALAMVAAHGAASRPMVAHWGDRHASDLSGLWRRHQARAVRAHFERRLGDQPVLLIGDMNELRPSAAASANFAGVLDREPTRPSLNARMPMAALDRVFVGRGTAAIGTSMHDSSRAVTAPDHLPAWVRLALPS
jgi:endonuclease/exonuclease/phosphatase family metal-dependent hydrolase